MKYTLKKALALLMALLLAVPTFALAEETPDGIVVLEETPEEGGIVFDPEIDPAVG